MKESDLTPPAFVGQPLPVAGVSKGSYALPYNSDHAAPAPSGHPERKSRDPADVTFKLSQRDPSARAGLAFSLGMTITRALP